jgi:two-component system OmpR family response regulator
MSRRARILVIDDDDNDRGEAVAALRAAGYVTGACRTEEVARTAAAELRPDLIVLEMVLGDRVVGPDLAGRFRANGDPPLLFVTHDDSLADRLAAFAAGADDYVVKPLATEELLARAHALLRRGGRMSPAVVQVGRLLVDERAHRVTFAGRDIRLGPIDFSLLAMLARHAGQVMSKSRLLELVWGYEAIDESLVEVHVCTTRRRLGPDGAGVLQTVRGVGYVVRDDRAADPSGDLELKPRSRNGG